MPRVKSKLLFKSISEKLKVEKKITPEFEVMLNTLTLEEILGLRLELAASLTNGKLYGLRLWHQLPLIIREAVLMYAYLNCKTQVEASAFLGVGLKSYYSELFQYGIINKVKRQERENER